MTTSKQGMMESIEFTKSDAHIAELLERLHEMADLQALAALAQWDQHTAMPPGAAEVRGHQMATLEGLLHERWTAARMGTLLDALEGAAKQANFTAADHGLIHSVRRGYNRMAKLPRTLVEEMARTSAGSIEAWVKARRQNDFASFAPWLQHTLDLQREVADRVGFTETRYDALLDEYEPGLTAHKVESLFAPVREVSTTMLQRVQNSGHTIDASCLQGHFPKQQQLELADKALRGMGYDFTRGQVALSAHPFTTSFGSPFDVRLTVRINEQYLQMSLMAALHEGGHALYEQGSAPTLVRTPVAGGASLGVHESQSRLWENYLGRSEPYWQGQYAVVREVFPERFANVDVATFVRALNKVEPSLIRVEADEVTYNLHILIRFELEKALVNGEISVESLPELWNAKYRAYLGIESPDNSDGVLQDMHWSGGFGYFPTYTLGNLYAAQIFSKLHKEFPDFDARLATGDTSFVLQWLRDRLYVYGAIYQPEELIERVTGELPDPQYFVRYLTNKFEKVYEL